MGYNLPNEEIEDLKDEIASKETIAEGLEQQIKELVEKLEQLRSENEKMRKALEEVREHCKAAGVPRFKDDWVLIEVDKIATSALK